MNWSSIYLFLFIVMFSCKQIDNPKVQFMKWAKAGAIIDNIQCKSDPNQSYCIYLPSNYEISNKYPVIYAFDPHGKGRIPVALMKSIAEKLGYIIIGSNSSKNGLGTKEINSIVNCLFTDTKLKLAIDPNRVYLVGFSGGARVACMIAQGATGIKGVVACSAGFQPNKNPMGFQFIGIAGTQDMNYLEMRRLNNSMDSVGIQNQFMVFNGKHKWPDEPTISEALTMLEIHAMQNFPSNKEIADDYLSINIKRIQTLKETNFPDSLVLAYNIAKRTFQTLNGIGNTESLKTTIDELSQMPLVQKCLNEQTSLELYEYQKQNEFASSFGSKPETWWNNKIKKLNIQKAGLKGNVSKRLLGYISLNCYGYVNGAFRYQDWKAVKYFTSIYIQVDPENPDSWYALARLQANTGQLVDAIESLRNSIKFGFSDFARIKSDPLLINVRGMEGYGELVKTK